MDKSSKIVEIAPIIGVKKITFNTKHTHSLTQDLGGGTSLARLTVPDFNIEYQGNNEVMSRLGGLESSCIYHIV